MKALLSLVIAFVGLSLVAVDADARRFGGGKNLGMQRSAPAQAPQKAAPAQQPQQQAGQAAPAQQPAGASKWLGPLAGLALGAGLAALFLNNGLAGLLAGLLVIGLLLAALIFLARALRGRLAQQHPLQYAGVPGGERAPLGLTGGAGGQSLAATTGSRFSGFDEAEFLRHAKRNFVRLQEAHDNRDLSTLSDFLTPDLYRQIEAEMQSGWGAGQKTEVVTLDAHVLDVAEESGSYIVSVRFSGLVREAAEREAEPVSEVWHLQKPVSGRSGWRLAGIQQA